RGASPIPFGPPTLARTWGTRVVAGIEPKWRLAAPDSVHPNREPSGESRPYLVISTGGIMGRRPTQGDEKRFSSNYPQWKRRPPLLSSRPELRRSVVERSAVQRSFPGN